MKRHHKMASLDHHDYGNMVRLQDPAASPFPGANNNTQNTIMPPTIDVFRRSSGSKVFGSCDYPRSPSSIIDLTVDSPIIASDYLVDDDVDEVEQVDTSSLETCCGSNCTLDVDDDMVDILHAIDELVHLGIINDEWYI